jgi:hypothetical protein
MEKTKKRDWVVVYALLLITVPLVAGISWNIATTMFDVGMHIREWMPCC